MKNLTKKLIGIAGAGVIALSGLIYGTNSLSNYLVEKDETFKREMTINGYAHVSPTKIEYLNGYEAEGFDDDKNGEFDRIVVNTFWKSNSFWGESGKIHSGTYEYKMEDENFSLIKENILNTYG